MRLTKRQQLSPVLPYGKWTCADGREVLFNRKYHPIFERSPGQPARPADPTEWIPWKEQAHFYHDGNPPWVNKQTRARCTAILSDFVGG